MLPTEYDVTFITNARSPNSVNSLVRRLLPEALRFSGSTFGKDNRYFLLAKISAKTLKLAQFPLWTGIEECLTTGTSAGARRHLTIPINAQYKGEWAAPPLLHTPS
jgi:hypothetical protein